MITIRKINHEDASDFIRAVNCCTHLYPWVDPPASEERFYKFVDSLSNERECWLAFNDSDIVGALFVHSKTLNSVEIGFYSLKPRNGYMREAAELLISSLLDKGYTRINACPRQDNHKAIQFLLRLNFSRTGDTKPYKLHGEDVILDKFCRCVGNGRAVA